MKRLRFGVAALAVSVLALGLFGLNNAQAAALTWNNGAANLLCDTTSANGGGATTGNNTTPDSATFGATGVGTISLNEAITAASITFSTAGYTIQSNTLTLKAASAGATTLTATESATINSAIVLSANNQAFSVAASKTLTLGGSVTGGQGLVLTGAGSTTFGVGTANTLGNMDVKGGTTVNFGGTSLNATRITLGTGLNSGNGTFNQTAGTITLSATTDNSAITFGWGVTGKYTLLPER